MYKAYYNLKNVIIIEIERYIKKRLNVNAIRKL